MDLSISFENVIALFFSFFSSLLRFSLVSFQRQLKLSLAYSFFDTHVGKKNTSILRSQLPPEANHHHLAVLALFLSPWPKLISLKAPRRGHVARRMFWTSSECAAAAAGAAWAAAHACRWAACVLQSAALWKHAWRHGRKKSGSFITHLRQPAPVKPGYSAGCDQSGQATQNSKHHAKRGQSSKLPLRNLNF